jgi:hypothetical protein
VRLVADGTIGTPQHFPLADPERLVIDLRPAERRGTKTRSAASSEALRVAVHTQGSGSSTARPRLLAAPRSCRCPTARDFLGGAALPVAAATARPPRGARGGRPGDGVQFDRRRSASASRLDQRGGLLPRDAADDETFLVSFPSASIDPDAAIRVAPDKPGAVSLVTAFQQPDATPAEVRVVVRRAKGLVPDVHREGAMLFLDFARPGDVAAGLPMLSAGAPRPPGGGCGEARERRSRPPRRDERRGDRHAQEGGLPTEAYTGVDLPGLQGRGDRRRAAPDRGGLGPQHHRR